MDKKIDNPHDSFFKTVWSKKENARDFLERYLPAELRPVVDLDSLEIQKDAFVDEELKEYYSDMLYKTKLAGVKGFVYFLFEHKSHPYKRTHLQTLRYVLKIWDAYLKDNPRANLPVVVPIVVYHGQTKWPWSERLSKSLINVSNEALKPYIPDFEFILVDLSQYSDDELKGIVMLQAALLLFKYVSHPDFPERLPEIFAYHFSSRGTMGKGDRTTNSRSPNPVYLDCAKT